jgi:pSer/pThr/pTyr-binding forkhead associated (FHA) protein
MPPSAFHGIMPGISERNTMNCILVFVSGNMRELYPVTEGTVTIGRESDNAIQILDETVSRHHARINNMSEVCEIEDIGGTNGVYVNGLRISRHSLKHGDDIRFGNTVLRFEHVDYDVANDTTSQNRDYSLRSQNSTIKITLHPEAEDVSRKKQTTSMPPVRLKMKGS